MELHNQLPQFCCRVSRGKAVSRQYVLAASILSSFGLDQNGPLESCF